MLFSALAQTARIAHFSHSGSVETLDAAADNFGIVQRYVTERVVRVSDTTAMVYGYSYYGGSSEHTPRQHLIRFRTHSSSTPDYYGPGRARASDGEAMESLARLKQDYPNATFIGFEPAKPKAKRKGETTFVWTVPQLPGGGPAVALILILSGAGWLLGKLPQPQAA